MYHKPAYELYSICISMGQGIYSSITSTKVTVHHIQTIPVTFSHRFHLPCAPLLAEWEGNAYVIYKNNRINIPYNNHSKKQLWRKRQHKQNYMNNAGLAKGYIRAAESAIEPWLPWLRWSFIDLGFDIGAEMSTIVRASALAVTEHTLLALGITDGTSWRVLPVVSRLKFIHISRWS